MRCAVYGILALSIFGLIFASGCVQQAEQLENISAFSQEDKEQGWYYGSLDQKKPGTPDHWEHTAEGTRSAKWFDPTQDIEETQPERGQDTWAIIVGHLYEDKPTANALWYYDLLTQYFNYDSSHTRLLTDQVGWANDWVKSKGTHVFGGEHATNPIFGDPTKENFLEAIDWLKTNSKPEDKVVLLFFTHGNPYSDEEGLDTDIEADGDDEVFSFKYQQLRNNIADGELAELLKEVKANDVIIYTGSCFGGGFIWDLERELGSTVNLRVIAGANEDEIDIANEVIDWAHEYPYLDRWGEPTGRILWHVSGMHKDPNEGLKVTPNLNISIEQAWLDFPSCTIPERDNMESHMVYVTPGSNGEFDYYSMCGGHPDWHYADAYLNDNQDLFYFNR